MIPRSIRWRLPLSYAAIALLAALCLGLVLLTTLRGYYARREADYLAGNARALSTALAQMVEAGLKSETLQAQIGSLSFLSQVRVQVLGADGRMLADSGRPEKRNVLSLSAPLRPAYWTSVTGSERRRTGPIDQDQLRPAYWTSVTGSLNVVRRASTAGVFVVDRPSAGAPAAGTTQPPGARIVRFGAAAGAESDVIVVVPAVGTLYGFGFDERVEHDGRRSSQKVRQPFYDASGRLSGYVLLSEGPAYGLEIVDSVARAWAIAGGVGVVLAAVAGWFASRHVSRPVLALTAVTARMAGGDFSARADASRRDEFGQLASSFNQMADQVERTIVALRRFVADAAHELHTPLTALRTDLDLAANAGDAATGAAFIERAQAQVGRLERLATSLLDLSRLEARAGRGEWASLDLASLLRQTSEPYASRAEQAGLTFGLELPGQAVAVRGNPAQLVCALDNLLDNAIKFTAAGGTVSLGLRREGAWAEVWVEDTGIGVPEQDLPQLFSRFHRGGNAAGYPGSGLGLAIVQAVAEVHGGQVSAENTGGGARFTLRLPVVG